MTRRGRGWAVTAMVLTVLTVAAAAFAPVPYVARSPGPVFDILGTVDDKQVLQIDGTTSYPTTGVLDMTTVAESGGSAGPMTVGNAIVGLVAPHTSVLPDPDAGQPESRAVQEAVFDASQSAALGAAADYLDRPVRIAVTVVQVLPGSAAEGELRTGDVILRLDGRRITDRGQVVAAVQDEPPGTTFEFTVARDGERRRIAITSRPDDEDPQRGLIGIVPENRYTSDFTATVNLDGIGGPSAGLMLATGMVDKLTPGDLLADRRIAGTGTIDGAGRVGPIGGIDKKMIAAQESGAQLFVAPIDNCPEVVAATPDGLQVVAVATLAQTVSVLKDWAADRPTPACPRTGDE